MVTIRDVAMRAGVSPSTVTHALNGKRPVGRATKKRIHDAIDALGYIPSQNASHLRSGDSGIIGCYAADITDDFVNTIVKGVERGLAGSGLTLLFVSGVEFNNNFAAAYRFLQSHHIEGLLLCHPIPVKKDTFDETRAASIPVISINMELAGVKSIIMDNYAGGTGAAEHLYASGMRRAAMICGPRHRVSSEQRLAGFRDRILGLRLPFDDTHAHYGDYSYKHGYEAAAALMKIDPEIDGIFCANDYIAAGAVNRLGELGRRVPADVRILGFDDRDFAAFWHIPLSTFSQPLEEMGFLGISDLRCAISAGVFTQEPRILQAKLIARESTGTCHYNANPL